MTTLPDPDRLSGQLAFLETLDQLKNILRRNLVARSDDGAGAPRRENTAEHSWHIAVSAMVLAEYAAQPPDVDRVVQMLLVHDLVEIHAGDTFCYDEAGNRDKAAREREATDRIFGLLPGGQGARLRALWDEFEAGDSVDSRFANAMDRFQVLLQNRTTEGGTWRLYGLREAQVRRRMDPIRTAAPGLWPTVETTMAQAVEAGQLLP